MVFDQLPLVWPLPDGVRTSIRVLENNDPAWRNKQTIEHTGTLNLTAGLLPKEEITKMSTEDIKRAGPRLAAALERR
jgi:hypothetical protein